MTELVMQTKKRLAVYPSLNLAVIFSLLHVTYWCGKGELQAVEYQGSEICTAQLCCCKPFHCGTNELLPCLLGQSTACPQPAGLLKERSLIRLIRKYASGVSLETRNQTFSQHQKLDTYTSSFETQDSLLYKLLLIQRILWSLCRNKKGK